MPTQIPAISLLAMLDATIAHAAETDIIPNIHAVHVETDKGQLITVATDKYTMGVARMTAHVSGRIFVDIPLKRAKELAVMLRRRKAAEVTLRQKDHGLTVDMEDTTVLIRPHGWRKGFDPVQDGYPFPEWRSKVTGAAANGPTDLSTIAFTPRFLARLSKAPAAVPSVIGFAGPNRAALIRIGDWFLMLIMPVRSVYERALADPFEMANSFAPAEPIASDVEKESA